MVKQKSLKSWLQKAKSSRHIKSLTDARLLLRPLKVKRTFSDYICSICSEKGSLLACIHCLKLFHLTCLGLDHLQLPLSEWACSDCSSGYYSGFMSSLQEFTETQVQDKALMIKKLTNKLNKVQKNTKLKDFESKHPHLVRHGQILYPIDDTILWQKPKLHSIQFTPIPPEHLLMDSNDYSADLIYICDFSHTFQSVLHSPSFICETLFSALSASSETELFKDLAVSLLRPLVTTMLKSESYRKKGPMLNYMVYKSKKIASIEKMLSYSYLSFIESILQNEDWHELIEEIDKDFQHTFRDFSFVDNFFELPVGYRLRLLVLVIELLIETKLVNEECNKRTEMHAKYMKDCWDINVAIRNNKGNEEAKVEMEMQIDEIKEKIASLPIRTVCVGSDRYYKEYYFFNWDPSKLYIKTTDKSNHEKYHWSFHQTKSEIQSLIDSLCPKGIRESSLIQSLGSLLEKHDFSHNEPENTHTTPIYNLNTLKTYLKDLHHSVARTIKVGPNSSYTSSIDSSDFQSLLILILTFHHSFIDKEASEDPYKTAPKVLTLWDYSEFHPMWESAVKECRNYSEAYLCMHLLANVVEKFNKEHRVVEVVESHAVTRRSFRLEKICKVKKEFVKEQDTACFVCGEFGLVACCDRCPRVAHLECLKIQELPEGEWNCPVCVEKLSNIRVTRSKQIKLNSSN